MKSHVVRNQLVDVGILTDLLKHQLQRFDLLAADQCSRLGAGSGLEDPPNLQKLQNCFVLVKPENERHRVGRRAGLEIGHIGAIAAPNI